LIHELFFCTCPAIGSCRKKKQKCKMKRDRGGDPPKNEVTNLTHGGELEQGAAITLLETEEEQ
jgi:hypothetical protein